MRVKADEKMTSLRAALLTLLAGGLWGAGLFAAFVTAFGLGPALRQLWGQRPAGQAVSFGDALRAVWNQAAETAGRQAYVLLPRVKAPAFTDAAASGMAGAVLLVFLAVLILVCLLFLRSGVRWLPVFSVLPALVLAVLLGAVPSAGAVVLLACGCLAAACVLSLGTEVRPWSFLIPAFCVLLLAAGLPALQSGRLPGAQALSSGFQKARARAAAWVRDLRYGEDPLARGQVSRIDGPALAEARTGAAGRKTALVLKGKDLSPLYLKGFVGEVYGSSGFQALPASLCYEARDQFQTYSAAGTGVWAQVYQAQTAAGQGGAGKPRDLTVVNEAAPRDLVYVPYELAGTPVRILGRTAEAGGAVTGNADGTAAGIDLAGTWTARGLRGARSYRLTLGTASVTCWPDQAASLAASTSGEAKKVLSMEAEAAAFYYAQDTQVPKALAARLRTATGLTAGRAHPGYRAAITAVRAWLADGFIESSNVPASGDRDPVTAFLSSKRGADPQFAAAAVLVFRSAGIPARYVEGYFVTASDLKGAGMKGGETVLSVSQSRLHAWPEIYVDGFGWVPVEVTPSYIGKMPEADLTRGVAAAEEGAAGRAAVPAKEAAEADADSPALTRLRQAVTGLWLLLLALLTGFLLWRPVRGLAVRFTEARRRGRSFRAPDPREGAASLYLWLAGRGASFTEAEREAGRRAAFSPHAVSEADRDILVRAFIRFRRERRADRRRRRLARLTRPMTRLAGWFPRVLRRGAGRRTAALGLVVLLSAGISFPLLTACGQDHVAGAGKAALKAVTEQSPGQGETGGAWAAIGAARAKEAWDLSETDQKKLTAFTQAYVDAVRLWVKEGGPEKERKGTVFSRTVLAFTAAGADPRRVEGKDLTAPLDDASLQAGQGVNAEAYALLAARASGIQLRNHDRYLKDVLAAQLPSGAFSLDGRRGGADLTAMICQVLAGEPGTGKQRDAAMKWLAGRQKSNGGFGSCETTSQVILALCALGRDPASDSAFQKAGKSPVDGLLSFRVSGGFAHTAEGARNDMATEQALLACEAVGLLKKGGLVYGK